MWGAAMKIRRSLLAGLIVACLWPAAHALGDGPALAQIQALVGASKQKNSGPLAEFAGLYDLLKSCRPPAHADMLISTLWLQTKWVIWFEGDDLVFAQLLAPANVLRGKMEFRQDYTAPGGGPTIKLYGVAWKSSTDIVAFLPDRELFGGKFAGGEFTATYTVRCRNEDQLLAGCARPCR